MYIYGLNFHINTLLSSIYKTLVVGGYYAHEGPIGVKNGNGWNAPTPVGSYTLATKMSAIEDSEFMIDHCRLLVNSGHFKLIEDVRYMNKWSMIDDINKVKHITLKVYDFAWDKNQKMKAGRADQNWNEMVSSDCLIQKITDVTEDEFRNDLKKMAGI